MFEFEWDPDKASANLRKHAVRFEDAAIAFRDESALVEFDREDPLTGEPRWKLIGRSRGLNILLVVHCVRRRGSKEVIRIISARAADRNERKRYGKAGY